jgi:benzoyl-CoA-dihydrodiol lyase
MSLSFETHPNQYKHWNFEVDGQVARLAMNVQIDEGLQDEYALKLNSYDLGVDIELCDAIQRLRFEYPEVRVVIVASAIDRVFCAGANIFMLQSSKHNFKVNFCKYTNETRISIEDACENSDQLYLAACNGTASGGGYELAMACQEIHLVDDGNSAVSLPEVPLLGVLPGTGGLTRLVDKRKVRRDRADVFSTLAEGIKGPRAVEWKLVDQVHPRSKFDDAVNARVQEIIASPRKIEKGGQGITLDRLDPKHDGNTSTYRYVTVERNPTERCATLTIKAPDTCPPTSADGIYQQGADYWGLRAWREVDHALIELRFNEPDLGLIIVKSEGNKDHILAVDEGLSAGKNHWFVNEVLAHLRRVLRRLDQTARSFFCLVEPGSCFAGHLFETALASDRIYMLDDPENPVDIQLGKLNFGALPMDHGPTRLAVRFYGEPDQLTKLIDMRDPIDTGTAVENGLVTVAPDDIDWEDDVRIAIEERVSYSPDALTGMEQNLRFVGPESMNTKVFGRLSAWQNWIFQRPNAVGPNGALTAYGKPERPSFNWTRT